MKKHEGHERTPARKLNRQELETGVLAAGCGTQGCSPSLTIRYNLGDPDPFFRLNLSALQFRFFG
jgi:hypothetical protein